MKMRATAFLLFAFAACLLWLPFDGDKIMYSTRPGGAIPAGEIQPGFWLEQSVYPQMHNVPPPRPGQQSCFALRLATYMRTNAGHLDIQWTQGKRTSRWRVDAASLEDNAYRHFCPRSFAVDQPFDLRVAGVDGKPGDSATLWLVGDRRFGTADLRDQALADKALALQVGTRTRVGPRAILHIDRGAFLFGWLCTLLIGGVALLTRFKTDH